MSEQARQVAIITGAGRGLGQRLAEMFAQQGYRVCACDLREDNAKAIAASIAEARGDAIGVGADVGSEKAVRSMVERVLDHWGTVDLLINAAGSYGEGFRKTHETPIEEWEGVLASNLTGSFLCAKHVLPVMVAQEAGHIINFSSNAGRTVSPLLGSSYTAAKAGVIGLTRHLAHEYAQHGIRANTICPGPVNGERVRDLLGGDEAMDELASQIPLGRLAEEDDIVDVALFLASDSARFMTGAILDVNGGLVLA